jgi:hypothetical protein
VFVERFRAFALDDIVVPAAAGERSAERDKHDCKCSGSMHAVIPSLSAHKDA